jgi:hypothetical protein
MQIATAATVTPINTITIIDPSAKKLVTPSASTTTSTNVQGSAKNSVTLPMQDAILNRIPPQKPKPAKPKPKKKEFTIHSGKLLSWRSGIWHITSMSILISYLCVLQIKLTGIKAIGVIDIGR